jgi:hypothetical protein
MSSAELSSEQREQVETDARLDAADNTSRTYKGDTLTDIVTAPIDAAAGTPSTTEVANAKQEVYDEARESISRRDR